MKKTLLLFTFFVIIGAVNVSNADAIEKEEPVIIEFVDSGEVDVINVTEAPPNFSKEIFKACKTHNFVLHQERRAPFSIFRKKMYTCIAEADKLRSNYRYINPFNPRKFKSLHFS